MSFCSCSCLILSLMALSISNADHQSPGLCSTLYLLHIVPYPDEDGIDFGWAKGLELTAAGHLAAQHINSNPSLLRGFNIKLFDIPTHGCAARVTYSAYTEIMGAIPTSQLECVFGVVGLYCSNTAKIVVPILSYKEFGFVQLASANSLFLRNSALHQYLFSIVASGSIYNVATIQLMAHFKWKKIGIIHNYLHEFYNSIGVNFHKLIHKFSDVTVIISMHVDTDKQIVKAFNILSRVPVKLLYLSVSTAQATKILCEAYKRQRLWPHYVYIFPDHTLSEILSYDGSCSLDEIKEALEGVIFLKLRLYNMSDTRLVSGKSFQEYSREYQDHISLIEYRSGKELVPNEYGNTLYDQVWAFALAANSSMDAFDYMINGSFAYTASKLISIRTKLKRALSKVSFQGASGWIQFDGNQEVQGNVDIFHIQNGVEVNIGVYESYHNSLTLHGSFKDGHIPTDSFEVIHEVFPWSIGVSLLIIQAMLLLSLLVTITAILYWHKSPPVKSSSLYITSVIWIGCLVTSLAPALNLVNNMLVIHPRSIALLICYMEYWLPFSGMSIVVASVMFRLMRIMHVFRSFHLTGKYWSDKFLTLYILVVAGVTIVILIVWAIIDPLYLVLHSQYKPSNPPYYLEHRYCSSKHYEYWMCLLFFWIGLLLVITSFFAISTRKIKRQHYKDTKKINIFVFCVCVICGLFMPLGYILKLVNLNLISFLLESVSYFTLIVLCQLLLFVPKYASLLVYSLSSRRSMHYGMFAGGL